MTSLSGNIFLLWALIFARAHATNNTTTIDYFQNFEELRENWTICDDPPPVANAYRWMAGEQVVYECIDGYVDKYERVEMRLNCSEITIEWNNGSVGSDTFLVWNGSTPLCQMDCGEAYILPLTTPPNVTNDGINILSEYFDDGVDYAEFTYGCVEGAIDHKNETDEMSSTCNQKSGQWNGPPSYCIYPEPMALNSSTTEDGSSNRQIINVGGLKEEVPCSNIIIEPGKTHTINYQLLTNESMDFSKVIVWYKSSPIKTRDCYKKSSVFNPIDKDLFTMNVTANSEPCVTWTSAFSKLGITDVRGFPGEDVESASNFCRNPLVNGKRKIRPYCYTATWGAKGDCDVKECSNLQVSASDEDRSYLQYHQPVHATQNYLLDGREFAFHPTTGLPHGTVFQVHFHVNDGIERRVVTVCKAEVYGRLHVESVTEAIKGYGYEFDYKNESINEDYYKCAKGFHQFGDEPYFQSAFEDNERTCSDNEKLAINTSSLVTDNDENSCIDLGNATEYTVQLDTLMEVSRVVVVQNTSWAPIDVAGIQVVLLYNNETEKHCGGESYNRIRSKFDCAGIPVADSVRVIFLNVNDSTLCEVKLFGRIFDDELECLREDRGRDYKGLTNQSYSGMDCLSWTNVSEANFHWSIEDFPDASLQDAENYCRNPSNDDKGPFCFVNNGGRELKLPCGLHHCATMCRQTAAGTDYTGAKSWTKHGDPCSKWSHHNMPMTYFDRHAMFYKGSSEMSHCRNPLRAQDRPWCFLQNPSPDMYYDYCNIPTCPTSSTLGDVVLDFNNTIDELMFEEAAPELIECLRYSYKIDNSIIYNIYDRVTGWCSGNHGKYQAYTCRDGSIRFGENGDDARWIRLDITCAPLPPTTTQSTTTTTTANTTTGTTATTATTQTSTATKPTSTAPDPISIAPTPTTSTATTPTSTTTTTTTTAVPTTTTPISTATTTAAVSTTTDSSTAPESSSTSRDTTTTPSATTTTAAVATTTPNNNSGGTGGGGGGSGGGEGAVYLTPTIDEKAVMMKSVKSLPILYGLCPQYCVIPCFNKNISELQIESLLNNAIKRIQKKLLLPKDQLSKTIRQKTSAQDTRSSSTSVGSLAVIFLIVPIIFILFIDGIRVYAYFQNKCQRPDPFDGPYDFGL